MEVFALFDLFDLVVHGSVFVIPGLSEVNRIPWRCSQLNIVEVLSIFETEAIFETLEAVFETLDVGELVGVFKLTAGLSICGRGAISGRASTERTSERVPLRHCGAEPAMRPMARGKALCRSNHVCRMAAAAILSTTWRPRGRPPALGAQGPAGDDRA